MRNIITFISVLLLTGCSHHLSMDSSSLDLTIQLDKSQYEIVGDIQGEASTSWLWLYFPIPLKTSNNYGKIYGVYHRSAAGQNAIYNAIESSGKDVDYIIAPKFDTRYHGFPPFLWKTTVKVTGKGVKLKEG